jgi:hypothetical protein
MTEFSFHPLYETGEDTTSYRLLTADHVSTVTFEGETVVKVSPEALTELARTAMSDVNYYYRTSHLESLAKILEDQRGHLRGPRSAELPGYRHGRRVRQEGPAFLDRLQR